jgi:hypothetical protein
VATKIGLTITIRSKGLGEVAIEVPRGWARQACPSRQVVARRPPVTPSRTSTAGEHSVGTEFTYSLFERSRLGEDRAKSNVGFELTCRVMADAGPIHRGKQTAGTVRAVVLAGGLHGAFADDENPSMRGPWQNTDDPELEWRLHQPFMTIMLGTGATAFVLYTRYYATSGAWFDWGLRTFWITYLPLVPYILRRWRCYLEATSAIRPEAVGGRDLNRITYWSFAALILPLSLIFFCGQVIVFSSALVCDAIPTTVAGTRDSNDSSPAGQEQYYHSVEGSG